MVRPSAGVTAPPGAASFERPQPSIFLGGYLIPVENFPNPSQVQPGSFANLAER